MIDGILVETPLIPGERGTADAARRGRGPGLCHWRQICARQRTEGICILGSELQNPTVRTRNAGVGVMPRRRFKQPESLEGSNLASARRRFALPRVPNRT